MTPLTEESFQSFLTIFPEGANSRPIPLKIVSWNWGGDLELQGGGWLFQSPVQYASPSFNWNPTLPFPTWNQIESGANLINN